MDERARDSVSPSQPFGIVIFHSTRLLAPAERNALAAEQGVPARQVAESQRFARLIGQRLLDRQVRGARLPWGEAPSPARDPARCACPPHGPEQKPRAQNAQAASRSMEICSGSIQSASPAAYSRLGVNASGKTSGRAMGAGALPLAEAAGRADVFWGAA